jgi:hypothetical protein
MRGWRRPAIGTLAPLILLMVMPRALALVHAQGPDGPREIMQRVLRDSRADDEVADVLMELVNARGRVRRRTTTIYSKKRTAHESARLIRFRDPPDLARSAILSIEHADRDADQWIYLPAYHAARRVASANRGDTWMGTDFTYEDITDADESVALKIDYYDRAGRLFKILTNAQLRRHGSYRRWDVTRVHDVIRNHQTVLTITDRKINRGLSDEYFDVSYLERGR